MASVLLSATMRHLQTQQLLVEVEVRLAHTGDCVKQEDEVRLRYGLLRYRCTVNTPDLTEARCIHQQERSQRVFYDTRCGPRTALVAESLRPWRRLKSVDLPLLTGPTITSRDAVSWATSRSVACQSSERRRA